MDIWVLGLDLLCDIPGIIIWYYSLGRSCNNFHMSSHAQAVETLGLGTVY